MNDGAQKLLTAENAEKIRKARREKPLFFEQTALRG
jgi:hypothetical protein